MEVRTSGRMDGRADGRSDRQRVERTDRWSDGQSDEHVDRRTVLFIVFAVTYLSLKVIEMMHEIRFREWSKLPENYPPHGMTPDQSKAEFFNLASKPETITDEDGPSEAYRLQIGVTTKKLYINREALVREQGYTLQDLVARQHAVYSVVHLLSICCSARAWHRRWSWSYMPYHRALPSLITSPYFQI